MTFTVIVLQLLLFRKAIGTQEARGTDKLVRELVCRSSRSNEKAGREDREPSAGS